MGYYTSVPDPIHTDSEAGI